VVGAATGLSGSWMFGSVPPATGDALTSMLSIVTIGYGLCELGSLKMPTCRISRQVPAAYRHRYSLPVVAAIYGLQLGAGVTTRITTAALYGLLLYILILGNPVIGAALLATYGLARNTFSTLLGWRTQDLGDITLRFTRVEALLPTTRVVTAVILIAAGMRLAADAWIP